MVSHERDRSIDWGLAVAAFAFASVQLLATPPVEPRAGLAEVRAIEDFGRIHDAGDGYAPWVRELIGLEGSAADTPLAVVEAAAEQMLDLPPGRELRLVVAAMAASYGVTTVAEREITTLEASAELPEAFRASLADLRRLGRGEAIDTVDRVVSTLAEAGASPWLLERVRARFFALGGDPTRAAQAQAAATEAASASIGARMMALLGQLALLILGALTLVLLPWARPRLVRRGFGLGPGPAPFVPNHLQRVMLGWFIGSVLTGWGFSSLGAALGPGGDGRLFAALLALQILTHGAVGVGLIQRFGRADDDHRPLGRALGLGLSMMPGRGASLVAWLLPGLGFAVLVTITAQIVNLFIAGEPDSAQGAIELLVSDGSGATFGLLALSAAIIAPVVEEILFRGYLYRTLRASIGPAAAVLFSGFVFGAVHLDPERILPLAALGAALALLYEWSGSLWVPIAVHGLWNFLQLASVWAIYHAQ